ncbi:MAG: MOSC domain-containing protein [Actinobacteria bacterium]|nr:MOSC domain-containing protein [Actinomycetota bacterium]
MGFIEAICISDKKGVVKKEISRAEMRADWGIVGDAHAGKWHRQVSLLAGESIDRVKQLMPDLARGAFAENIITRGVELTSLKIGARLAIGDNIVLEVTQIGKKCHHGCVIKQTTGDCIMPREGIFARVIRGGVLSPGLPARIQTERYTISD